MTAMLVVAADGARVGTTHVRCFDDGHSVLFFCSASDGPDGARTHMAFKAYSGEWRQADWRVPDGRFGTVREACKPGNWTGAHEAQ